MHTCLLPAPFNSELSSSQSHVDHLELPSSFFAKILRLSAKIKGSENIRTSGRLSIKVKKTIGPKRNPCGALLLISGIIKLVPNEISGLWKDDFLVGRHNLNLALRISLASDIVSSIFRQSLV